MGGMEGEEEGREFRDSEEENIVEPKKFLKVIHGCGTGREERR